MRGMKANILFRPFFLLFAALMGTAASAQTIVIRVGQHPGSGAAVQNWTPAQPAATSSVSSETPYYVQEIMNTVGLKPNFELRAARIDNAAAVVYGGKRYILYNPTFIDNLVRRTGNKWAAVSVLAHEIGHHLDGHTVTSAGSVPQLELEADEFSGFVLHKMGATLGDAQAAMKAIANDVATATHPGRSDRLVAIAKGWNKVSGADGSSNIAKVMQQPIPQTQADEPGATASYPQTSSGGRSVSRTNTVLADRYVLGDLTFNSDPYSRYYVTTQYNVVKVKDGGLQVLGKLARMNDRNFPYVIYDNETKLYVHQNGTVLSQSGRAVGKLTARA